MIRLVASLQFTNWRRDRLLRALLLIMALGLTAVSSWSTAQDIARGQAREEAAAAARGDWDGRGDAHPHSMAHFGDFAFRPSGPLARLDRGVQARVGKVLRIEGHRQGKPLHSDASRAGTVARFGGLDPAFLLQVVVPLLLIFLGAMGLSADRESGRLKLSLVQGASARAVLVGHVLALWLLGLTLLILVVVASLGTSALLGSAPNPEPARLAGFMLVHALFLGVVASAVVATATSSLTARSALPALLAVWVIATALLPRMTASSAGALHPLPGQDAFQAGMRASREAGPDGHNPKDALVEKRRKEVLEEYGVDSVEALPINFDGIAMQMDEEFANAIQDEHYGELEAQMLRQTAFASRMALLNPLQAVDNISMALAGTDLTHDLDFQRQAEAHRRSLIKALNDKHAYGGSKTGERGWKAKAEFFAGLGPFRYEPPDIVQALRPRAIELLALVFWFLLLGVALSRGGASLGRGRLRC